MTKHQFRPCGGGFFRTLTLAAFVFVALAISIAINTPSIALATDSDNSKSWVGKYGYEVTLSRLAGENADETAAAISQTGFDTSKYAIIARWDDFADALGASGLAGTLDCPILLTCLDTLSQATIDELKRLGAETVYVIGGTGAISEQIDKDLDNISTVKTHKRIWGEYSWDTSLECANAITEHGGNPRSEAIVAVSYNFQDALSISSYAYAYQVPLILEDNSFGVAGKLTDQAVSFINNTEGTIWVVGGTVAVREETVEGVFTNRTDDIVRLCGEDGYDTSNQIATYMTEHGSLSVETVGIASGGQRAHGVDALAGAALIGQQGGVMLLANGNDEMEEINYTTIDADADSQGSPSFLTKNRLEVIDAYVLGGTVVAPTAFFDKVEQILRYTPDDDTSTGKYWLATADATDPEDSSVFIKGQAQIDEDMKVLHGTATQTSGGKDKAAVTTEYMNYMNGLNSDGTQKQEVRLYTKWNGDTKDNSGTEQAANQYVEFRIIQVGEHDGDGSAVTFMATHSLPSAQQMNPKTEANPYGTNAGGWEASYMRTTVFGENGYVQTGLSGLKDAALTLNKKATSGSYDSDKGTWVEGSTNTTADKFWLLSYSELAGEDKVSYFKNEGSQYDWCKDNVTNPTNSNPAIAGIDVTRAGSYPAGHDYSPYWLRSPYVIRSDYFGCVYPGGHPYCYAGAGYYMGVAPALAL